jgi:hypothetical protein
MSRRNISFPGWWSAVAGMTILLQGCAAPAAPEDSEAHYVLENGSNEISGKVAIISTNGYTRTCDTVTLLPVTPYWTNWRNQAFSRQDYAPRFAIQNASPDAVAQTIARHGNCDSEGRFHFTNVADGRYYVFSTVFWLLRWQQNGGGFMQGVEVRGGEKVEISMIKDSRASSSAMP